MSTISQNTTLEEAKLQKAIAGLNIFPATSQLNIAGKDYTSASIAQVFQAALTAIAQVQKDRAQLASDVAAQSTARTAANQLYVALHAFVEATYGKGSPQLAAMGYPSGVKSTPGVETKALAAAKAKQTRAARGTTSKKQKSQVTVAGSPGLQLVAADGTPVPGMTQGPIAPAKVTVPVAAGTVTTPAVEPAAATAVPSSK